MRLLILASAQVAALALAGCQTTPPPERVVTVEVKVPTPVPCINDKLGGAPDYPDTDEALLAAKGPGERYSLLSAGRPLRIQRLSELEAIAEACRVLAPAP
jgi:hypothetical protein